MALQTAKKHLAQFGAAERIQEFPTSSATVELAAQALGCAPCHIAKTLSFSLSDGVLLIVTAGDVRIDNAKFRTTFHIKARMLPAAEVERAVGHAVGGVCPFGVNPGVSVYLDESLRRFDTVFPACGSENSAIELTLSELEQFSGSLGWVDVCKKYENSAQS